MTEPALATHYLAVGPAARGQNYRFAGEITLTFRPGLRFFW